MSKANSKKSMIYAVLVAVAGTVAGGGILAASASAGETAAIDRDAARDLFHSYSCSACHSLTDAGAGGSMGPTLENPAFTREFVIDRITNGQGAMPSFEGQLTEEEIALLADYIVAVSHEGAQ